jgi:LmbE family N-acetylglucosaminyl deacetylase
VPELDTTINPNDHMDHRYTAIAVRDAMQSYPCIDWIYHTDYAIKSKARNLSAAAADIKAGVWGVTNSGLVDFNHQTTWEPNHNVWLGREYFRTVVGTVDCNF